MTRPYHQWERRLITEWAVLAFTGQTVSFNVRLGDLPNVLSAEGLPDSHRGALLGAFRRFADAVVWGETSNVLIEAKMRAAPIAVGELLLYERELPSTPDAFGNANLPVDKVLLCAIEDPSVTQLASDHGIRVVVHRPSWLSEWLETEARRGRPVAQVS